VAGRLQRAGGGILRRATAAGLSGLAFALFVGVMAFAFTTNPANEPEENTARYLATASRVADLRVAMPRAEAAIGAVASMLPGQHPASEAAAPELTPVPGDHVDLVLVRALEAETDTQPSSIESEPVPAATPAEVAASPEPHLAPGERAVATISFYYCERGTLALPLGDGGGFCGAMRDGTIVYPGAAACAYKYLGQRFRIIEDPLEREYVCADTGSAVHGLHRDIWFHGSDEGWNWQLKVGQTATIEILP
jgi:hypothetical protein